MPTLDNLRVAVIATDGVEEPELAEPVSAEPWHIAVTSLTGTDGLVELPEDTTSLEPGAEVAFIPYSELI